MNIRQMDLIRELLDYTEPLTISALAATLHCSERTVHYDIAAINNELARQGLASTISGRRGIGVALQLQEDERCTVEGLVQGGTLAGRTDLERFMHGMLIVLTTETGPVRLGALASSLYVTERQLRNDIRRWNQMLAFFGCEITVKGTVDIIGNEFGIRLSALYLFCSFAPVTMRDDAEQHFRADAPLMERALREMEQWRQVPFSENARHTVKFSVGLILSRLRQGKQVSLPLSEVPSDPVFTRICQAMEKSVGAPVDPAETVLLYRIARCSTRRYDVSQAPAEAAPSTAALEVAEQLLEPFGLQEPSCDSALRATLANLVDQGAVRHRLSSTIPYRDPFSIKVTHMAFFARTIYRIWLTCKEAGMQMFNGDLDRIALLLLSAKEQVRGTEPFRAALVVNCGVEQVVYAVARLNRLLPSLEVEPVMPADLEQRVAQTDRPIHFVIAFEHIVAPLPVCQISFTVGSADIVKIGSFIASGHKPDQKGPSAPEPFALPSLTVQLYTPTLMGLPEAIRAKAHAEGIIDTEPDLFAEAFNVTCVLFGDMGVAVLPLPSVRATAARLYLTPPLFIGRTINRFAVLFIRDEDANRIDDIVAAFKMQMDIPDACDVSWELPPLLNW